MSCKFNHLIIQSPMNQQSGNVLGAMRDLWSWEGRGGVGRVIGVGDGYGGVKSCLAGRHGSPPPHLTTNCLWIWGHFRPGRKRSSVGLEIHTDNCTSGTAADLMDRTSRAGLNNSRGLSSDRGFAQDLAYWKQHFQSRRENTIQNNFITKCHYSCTRDVKSRS